MIKKSWVLRVTARVIEFFADKVWEFTHRCDYCGKPIRFSPGIPGPYDDEYVHKRCAKNYSHYLNTGVRP